LKLYPLVVMAAAPARATGACPMALLRTLLARRPAPVLLAAGVARAPRAALADAAVALADVRGEPGLEHLLHVTAAAAARVTGAGGVLVLADAPGRLGGVAGGGVQ